MFRFLFAIRCRFGRRHHSGHSMPFYFGDGTYFFALSWSLDALRTIECPSGCPSGLDSITRGLDHWIPSSGVPSIRTSRICHGPLNLLRPSSLLTKNSWHEGRRVVRRATNSGMGAKHPGWHITRRNVLTTQGGYHRTTRGRRVAMARIRYAEWT